jgi:hypothetical protein
MRQMIYKDVLTMRLDPVTRSTIEKIATEDRVSMAEVTRDLIGEALTARGMIG